MIQARELFTMWRSTRLVVLTSVLAAIYAAAVIPFKAFTILPGVSEIRPGVVFPPVFSILFGPAAAWGAAIGNTIGDLFGSFGPGSFFGFLGNLLYGYIPYRVWRAWRRGEPRFRSTGDWLVFGLAVTAASAACGLVIAWGIHLLGLFPFEMTALLVFTNNLLVGMVLGPPLLLAIYPRVARMNLLYSDLAGEDTGRADRFHFQRAGTLLIAGASLAGLAAGYLAAVSPAGEGVGAAVLPFVLALLLVAALV